jgi:hypothetical protein
MHHLVSDGLSIQIFYRELMALYHAFASGLPSPLPELPIQYADFASWQRQWLQGEVLERMLSYWRKQLSGVGLFPGLELPFARPLPAVPTYLGATQTVTLSDELFQRLKHLSHRSGVTLYMLFLAAVSALLSRYTGQERIALLSAIANRSRTETQGLIGWFSNNQILSTDLSDNPRFSELIEQAREVTLGAYAHQEIPLPLLISSLLPYFEDYKMPQKFYEVPYVYFNMMTQTRQMAQTPGLTISSLDIASGTAENGITIGVTELARALKLGITYATDRFDPADISRMLERFQILLANICHNPEARLMDLSLDTTDAH